MKRLPFGSQTLEDFVAPLPGGPAMVLVDTEEFMVLQHEDPVTITQHAKSGGDAVLATDVPYGIDVAWLDGSTLRRVSTSLSSGDGLPAVYEVPVGGGTMQKTADLPDLC